MKLVKVYHREDFGDEYVLALLTGKNKSFLQVSVGWNVYGGGFYSQASSGYGRIFSFLFSLGHFDFAFDFCANNWNPDGHLGEDAEEDENFQTSLWEETYYPEEYEKSKEPTVEDPCMPPWGHSDLEYQNKNNK